MTTVISESKRFGSIVYKSKMWEDIRWSTCKHMKREIGFYEGYRHHLLSFVSIFISSISSTHESARQTSFHLSCWSPRWRRSCLPAILLRPLRPAIVSVNTYSAPPALANRYIISCFTLKHRLGHARSSKVGYRSTLAAQRTAFVA